MQAGKTERQARRILVAILIQTLHENRRKQRGIETSRDLTISREHHLPNDDKARVSFELESDPLVGQVACLSADVCSNHREAIIEQCYVHHRPSPVGSVFDLYPPMPHRHVHYLQLVGDRHDQLLWRKHRRRELTAEFRVFKLQQFDTILQSLAGIRCPPQG